MKIGNLIKITIRKMDTISIIVKDSNYWRERINITHDEAYKLVSGDLLYSYKIKVTSSGQHMTITVN